MPTVHVVKECWLGTKHLLPGDLAVVTAAEADHLAAGNATSESTPTSRTAAVAAAVTTPKGRSIGLQFACSDEAWVNSEHFEPGVVYTVSGASVLATLRAAHCIA